MSENRVKEGKVTIADMAVTATKWSFVTQFASKLISPLTTLVLAHLLTPEVFGVVALVTMVTSFADMFSDAGFQKYLIQHEYSNDTSLNLSANVAFWSNLAISCVLWGLIIVFRDDLALTLGDATIGTAIAVASAALPFTALVSVQTAVYQRRFDFKTLFYSQVGSAALVFVVAVPLAFLGMGYWSMIISTLFSKVFLAVWLTWQSEWKPAFLFSWSELMDMFSFSFWTLAESFSLWLTNWAGAFILGNMLNAYYLGLYNTSTSVVTACLGIISNAVKPVAFSAMSRYQGDGQRFRSVFYKVQKSLALVTIPVGACIWAFSDLAVTLYLGEDWTEAAAFFGNWALMVGINIPVGHVASEAYRSLGLPKLCLKIQTVYLVVDVAVLLVGASQGFETLSYMLPSSLIVAYLFLHFAACKIKLGLSPVKMLKGMVWPLVGSLVLAVAFKLVQAAINPGIIGGLGLLALAVVCYFVYLLAVPDMRALFGSLLRRFGMKLPSRAGEENRLCKFRHC